MALPRTFCTLVIVVCLTVVAAAKENEDILIKDAHGLVLISPEQPLLKGSALSHVSGIQVIDLDLPGPLDNLKIKLEPLVLGKNIDKDDIYAIRRVIAQFYEDYAHPLVVVEIPHQEVRTGVLQLVVVEARIGVVTVEGNCQWSNEICLKRSFELGPNDLVDNRHVTSTLNFFNRNPFRNVAIVYEPGEKEGTTDVHLLVYDRRPFQVYAGVDNTNLDITGRVMEYAGFNWGNAFNAEHLLSAQFATSTPDRMWSLTGSYTAPLPWKHVWQASGGFVDIFPDISQPFLTQNSGYFIQASTRYIIPLRPTETVRHEITAGADYKRLNTDLAFTSNTALVPFHQPVNVTELMVGYTGYYRDTFNGLDFNLNLFGSPGRWLHDQTNANFNALRPGAKNKWIYAEGFADYKRLLPESFVLVATVQGQWSTTALLPSEQFGLGGYSTVRGYDERVLNEDGALLLIAEIHTPSWQVFTKKNGKIIDGIHFLAFLDYGIGYEITFVPGTTFTQWIAGVGPGVRYILGNNLSCRFDVGFKLHNNHEIGTNTKRYKFHFGVIGSY